MRFVFLTIDGNHTAALQAAAEGIRRDYAIDFVVTTFTAPQLHTSADRERLDRAIAGADVVFGARLFGEEYVRPIAAALAGATGPVCIITSNPALMHHTRLGRFSLSDKGQGGSGMMRRWLSKLRPQPGAGEAQRQLTFVRSLTGLLKRIPGRARDLHTYIVAHQYWAHPSPENMRRLLCLLIERYVPGYSRRLPVDDPLIYPDSALIHPDAPAVFNDLARYRQWRATRGAMSRQGVVGLLTMRTVALSGNTAHLDALVRALEQRGIEARLAYTGGLDMRPAIEQFFAGEVDLLVNCAGFSLVGGPAESRPQEARVALEGLGVGYMGLVPLAFQQIEAWQHNDTGLSPIHSVMNIAVPELDGATEPWVFGGPSEHSESFVPIAAQVDLIADRIARRVALRRTASADKRLAIVLFNYPPGLGSAGSAAYLDVFASLLRLLQELRGAGYNVDVPANVDELRAVMLEGNAMQHGTDGNVAAALAVDDYRRLCAHHREIERCWGPAPGDLLTDGRRLFVLGARFGNIFVGIQPGFGYERDPMQLLMAKDATPHHAFAAFYTWIDRVFEAHAVLHFGTHGALEFMPGKQVGMSDRCWPTRLLGGLPHFYYYSSNNPSEATIAKRRSAATTISYLTPPLQQAGLYKGLRLLKDSLDRYRQRPGDELRVDIEAQAERLGLGCGSDLGAAWAAQLAAELAAIEERLIPSGLHVLGHPPAPAELCDTLALVATYTVCSAEGRSLPAHVAASLGYDHAALSTQPGCDVQARECWEQVNQIARGAIERFVSAAIAGSQHQQLDVAAISREADDFLRRATGASTAALAPMWASLSDLLVRLCVDGEVSGLLNGLAGGYVAPGPANDIVRNPAVAPTGRNLYGLDPGRIPSAQAQAQAAQLVTELLEQLSQESNNLPEAIALVLWGSDNLKSEGEGIAQALALLGARVVLDELGQVCDIALVPLTELGRPRIDIVVSVSGIFRDLLEQQMRLIDRAARLAAAADEPWEQNFVRKHTLAHAAALGVTPETAAARVFANAPGSYGAHVNHLVESGSWEEGSELSDTFLARKSFTIDRNGGWVEARGVLEQALASVEATFQNIDSFEVGISDIDTYYENLGAITHCVETLRGTRPPVLLADALPTAGRVSSLERMLRIESHAKLLNPAWYEAMLSHGYQGVHEIETRVGNTYGWSATAGAVEGWIFQGIAETYVLDEALRERLVQLNPHAAAGVARRLLEAHGRGLWNADEATIERLRDAYESLENQLEGVAAGV